MADSKLRYPSTDFAVIRLGTEHEKQELLNDYPNIKNVYCRFLCKFCFVIEVDLLFAITYIQTPFITFKATKTPQNVRFS